MTTITAAIRADAATSDAEGRRDLAGHLADFRAALLDEAALLAASDRASHAREVVSLTEDITNAVASFHDAAASRDNFERAYVSAIADLNATREKLATAEAHCNSFQHERDMAIANRAGLLVERDAVAAERDRLRSELTSMTIMRDKAHAHLAAISASLGVESVSILATIERVRDDIKRKDREWSAMRDERDAIRAELNRIRTIADDERAEFVLAAVAVAQALDDGRSLGPCADSARRDPRAWVRFARELADRVKASRAEVAELRARPELTVERLEDATANARSDRNARGATEGGFFPALSAAGIMAKLGAVTLPAQDRADDVIAAYVDEFAATAEREGMSPPDRWADVPDKRRAWCAGVMSRALASLGAPATTPSKPADVFAGVSIEELAGIYAASFGATTAQSPARIGAIRAVLDALRVRLVAPVDPIVVATDYHDHPSSAAPFWMCDDMDGFRVDAARAMRATLTAAGIPVTPEAGK